MPKKEEVIDKKMMDKYRKQFTDDFDKNYREKMVKDLSEDIYKDVQKNFDVEYKNQLVSNVTNDILDEVKNKVNKEERKISAHKSFKIFRLSVYIIVLLLVVIYVMYRLYVTGNLAIIKYNYKPNTTDPVVTQPTDDKKDEINYKELYGNLIDNIKIYDESLYKGNTEIADLEMSKRLQIAYSTLNKDDIEVDGSINILRGSLLKSAYTKLFGLDDFKAVPFTVYNLNFIYSTNKNEFIAIKNEENNTDIKYELLDASVDENNIYIKAYAVRVENTKIYSISSNKEIGTIDDNLADHKSEINVVTFVFNKDKNLTGIMN